MRVIFNGEHATIKSLAGFVIFPSGAIFAFVKRYALQGTRLSPVK